MTAVKNVPNLLNSYRMQRLFPQGRAAIICPIDHGIIFPRALMRAWKIRLPCSTDFPPTAPPASC